MKRKGFTLIELLAVIVILAVIALIATPIVLNTIDEARKGAASSSAATYIKEVEKEIITSMMTSEELEAGKYTIEDLSIELKGNTPTEGNICISTDGIILKASLKINGYVVNYDREEATTKDLKDIENIDCKGQYQEYYTGTNDEVSIIYYDPETNTKCNEEDAVSTTGTKASCMKWYAIENSDSFKSTVDVILDHNTTAMVAWNLTGNNADGIGETELAKSLTDDTEKWLKTLNPRLITATEVARISGSTDFDVSSATKDDWFYFGSNDRSDVSSLRSNYSWLYNYTYECAVDGCEISDSSTYGYWTEDPVYGSSEFVWGVSRIGALNFNLVERVNGYGIRPVITISKDVLI